ncbi:MAG: thiol reductant ABC exporter subunit CydD, partial [Propionibacteriaceae bacterium]|nr:thiol reductant ABC exporter subunit CydD [Propionibacteriaceae bacterium]
ALAGIFTAKGVLTWLTTWLGHRTSAAVKSQLRTEIVNARLAKPIDSAETTGGLITLVTQGLDALDGYYAKYLPQLLLSVTVPLIIVIAVLTTDLTSTIIIFVTVPLIPVFMMLIGWTTRARTARRWKIQTRLAHHFSDLVMGLPTLQVFGRAKAQAKGLLQTETAHRGETLGTLRISFLSAMVLELLASLSVAVVAVTIAFRVVAGDLDLQTALFVLILAPEAYLPLRQLGTHFHDSADGVAAANAAFALIGDDAASVPPVVEDSPASQSAALLQVAGLSHTYPDAEAPAVSDFDLEISEGEIVALAGSSGAGKTTVLNVIMGFLRPDAGCLQSQGRTITDFNHWRTQVAFVGQNPGMISGTVADNLRLGYPKTTDSALRAALDEAGAPEITLDHLVETDGEGVSAGERRRIATARALLKVTLGRAKLLIMDEPTAGLDAESEAVLLAALRRLNVAALVISHRPSVLELADRVVHLSAPSHVATQTEKPGVPARARTSIAAKPADVSVTETPDTSSTIDTDRPLISRILAAVTNSRKRLALAVLLSVTATFAAIVLLGGSSWLLAFAATMPPIMFLNAPAVVVRFCAISRGLFRYGERLASHDVALRLQSALRIQTYSSLSRTTLLGRRRGDLLSRVIADVEAIQDLVVRVWIPFASSTLVILLTCGLLALVSPLSALILLGSATFAGWVVPVLARRASFTADRSAVGTRGELANQVHEMARTGADLVAYGADVAFIQTFEQTDLALRKIESRATWVRGVAEGFQVIAAGVGVIGAICAAASQITTAGLWTPIPIGFQSIFADPGIAEGWPGIDNAAFALIALLVITPLALHESLNSLARAAQNLTRAQVALKRVEAVLDAPSVGQGDIPTSLETEAAPMLRIEALAAGWPDSQPVVKNLSLRIDAGERVALTGRSGIGKTTVAATVLGLIDPVAGELEIIGRPGYLAQDAHIFDTSVTENVRIGNRDASDEAISQALIRAGLGYLDPMRIVGEAGAALSGGEVRRLAMARLLVGQYQVLILDEPTEHLDLLTASALLDDIWEITKDLPLLVISHDLEVLARCDRVIRLD